MADSPTQHGDQDTQAAILKLTEQVMNLMTIFTQNQTPPAAASSTTVASTFDSSKLMDTISSRIPMFTYVPEEEKTFEGWFNRYEEIVTKDGAQLADDTKTRVILAKLSPTDYAHYTNRILPKVPNELSFNETIGVLKTTFKSTTSVFRKRQEFLRSEYSGGSLEEYTGSILRGYTSSEFKKMSDDQLCCLIWINGMKDSSYQDIRTRALQVLEQKPRITLLEMEAEVKRVLDIRADSKAVAPSNQSPEVQAVQKKPQNQHNQNKTEKQPPSPCYRCGGNHWSKDCKYQTATCRTCNKTGHLAKSCRSKPRDHPKVSHKVKTVFVGVAATHGSTRIYKSVTINGKPIKMLLDTGADVTLVNLTDWKRLGRPKLEPPSIRVRAANNQVITVKGSFNCNFELNGVRATGTAHVTETNTLLGIDWVAQDQTFWKLLHDAPTINSASTSSGSACSYLDGLRDGLKVDLSSEYPDVFQSGLGLCKKMRAKLKLKPNAKPVFRKSRPVPYASLEALSNEIDRLEATGVLKSLDHSDWAAPVVAVTKKNGSIRLCSDFSTGLNDAIEAHQHPLPTADDIFAKLNGGKFFSQIDLADAYLQIEVDDDSKKLLVINTHKGLFHYNKLPFGVKAAPGIFQQVMDTMLAGLDGVACYLDDIIVTGCSIEEHNQRVKKVIERIASFGFRMRLEKCSFLMPEIQFLGFVINEQGRKPDPQKIADIKAMPAPKNAIEVRSFLGLIQFYGTFVRDLHRLRPPLDKLTNKDVEFKWDTECQHAFDQVKEMLQSDLLLTHYNPKVPIIVAADASQYGIGATISHRFPDGKEKAIYHVSKALNKAQRNYSQIEKEAFGLVTAVTKFHKFVHGRRFTLRTDHKPLLSIFGEKKGVPIYTANRLQRWATILMNYNFSIEYINTKDFGQVDALSRLISDQMQQREETEEVVIAHIEGDIICSLDRVCDQLPVTVDIIRSETHRDKLLMKVMECIRSGKWPVLDKAAPIWLFQQRQTELSIVQECVMIGERIVLPTSLKTKVLLMLHRGHPGIVRMKKLARSYVYWPAMDKDIENLVKCCDPCAGAAKNPVKDVLHSWPCSTKPWNRVHADYCGPLQGIYYLVIVDSYSKWPEVYATKSITTSATIHIFRQVFAQFGNPEILVTDNGSQFSSKQLEQFCKLNGITHVRSPPFHPQSNGQAERFVDTLKRALQKLRGEGNSDSAVTTFLQTYRATPCAASPNGLSPAENFLNRKLRTELDLLLPMDPNVGDRNRKMEEQFNNQHGARPRHFVVNQKVYVKDYRSPKATWIPGIIIRKLGGTIYDVRADDKTWRRHANQLRIRSSATACQEAADLLEMPIRFTQEPITEPVMPPSPTTPPLPTNPIVPSQPASPSSPPLRRSSRNVHPPKRLCMDPKKKSYRR
ncbi:hypothetical protein CRE_03461 [Caenorhabditis remanei]|uniref:RNA-directed DNA polymerase n=1 Tax=Caenorhabditis remanei TaxID=31234 RepID=E3NGN3_CAERE|nr:hypothetical protein CRE_03461 [Caenorhabditis remanei]